MKNTQIYQSSKVQPHHRSGVLLMPLFTWQGRDIYPVRGAEGDEGEGGEPDGEPDADDEDEAGKGETKPGGEPVSREEFDQLRKQLSAADKRRDEAEKKLKAIDDANKDELTKATERAQELQKVVEGQEKQLAEMRLQNAFLTAETGITWHDPADALDIAERRGYLEGVVDEDGKVNAKLLGTKLRELAKAKPNLVKDSGEGPTDGSKNGKGKEEVKTPTGSKVGSKGTGGNKTEDKVPSRYDKFMR